MTKKSVSTDFRPGSVGYYLTGRGWEPVENPNHQFPLWRKGDQPPIEAKEALYEVYREIWRECRPRIFPVASDKP